MDFKNEVMREKGGRGGRETAKMRSKTVLGRRADVLKAGVRWRYVACVGVKVLMRDANSQAGPKLCEGRVCSFEVEVE